MTKRLFLLVIAPFAISYCSYCQTPAPAPAPVKKAAPAKKVAPAPAPALVQKTESKPVVNELTVEQVAQLVQAGLPEDMIIDKIKKNNKPFDLTTDQLLELKKAGASNNIIRLLMDPTAQPVAAPAAPAVPALPVAETTTTPRVTVVPEQPKKQDTAVSRVPGQAGVYYLNGTELLKIDLKTLASAKAAGRLGHLATFGIKSIKINAYLIGPSAKTRVKETSPTFYVRLPENYSIDELVLVSLYAKPDRRELEVSAQKGAVGAKQGLRMEVMKPIETQEVGPNLYKIATNILGKGEYLFYLVGSADSIKGIQGKGYDFGIE